ncbi:glycosyltransferase family 9 protein, partial [Streptomyces sp. G44]|nr:glycosyltransferase family 9 protein [Streptomyces sp. G44]
CPLPGHPCLDGVDDAEVLAAVAAFTDRAPGPAGRARQARPPTDPMTAPGRRPGTERGASV